MNSISIGVDIGGTNTVIGVVNDSGQVLRRVDFPTRETRDGPEYCRRLGTEIHSLLESSPNESCRGVGIGAPNGSSRSGCIENPPNLPFGPSTPIVEILRNALPGIPVFLTNDANAAAVGEKRYGAARRYEDFIMITLGTGLGSGIFVRNELVLGHDGFAGEIGHMSVIPEGRYDSFGRRGSLENYCSATGIRRTFFEMLAQRGEKTQLDHLPIQEINSRHVSEAAVRGCETCKLTMDFTGRLLGEALASAALVTNPAAFFLFGGPVQAGETLLTPLRTAFEKHLIPQYKGRIEILVSSLPPGDAAILGAAALVE